MVSVCYVAAALATMMKWEGILALLLFICGSATCTATSATARSKRALEYAQELQAEAETVSSESSLDETESTAAQRRVLLSRLRKSELFTATEQQALQETQRVLIGLEQEQETQASKLSLLEAAERSSSRVVQEEGTMSNQAEHTDIMRESYHREPSNTYAVSMQTHQKTQAGSKAKTSNDFIVLMHGPETEFWQSYNKAFWEKMTGILMYMVQIFVVAFLYMQFCKQSVTPKLPESQVRIEEFQYGAFDASECARDCQMCVCACCCPWIRWAETGSKDHIQFLAFVPGLFISALLAASGSVTFGLTIPILLLIVVLCRQRIREAYALPFGTCGTILNDCFLWLCCPCCAIVQEARQVEYVEVPMQEYGTPLGTP